MQRNISQNSQGTKAEFFQAKNPQESFKFVQGGMKFQMNLKMKGKNSRLQDWQKPFVLVHTYAWASLKKYCKQRVSASPVI